MKRKALGKGLGTNLRKGMGLDSLLPKPPQPSPQETPAGSLESLRQVDIDQIHPNPRQPRKAFREPGLTELAQSLKSDGVIQPIVVRPRADGHFELIAGERRWRAAQIAGLLKLPVLVRSVTDNKVIELALIENLQREQLNPIEEAAAYQMLIDDAGLTQQEIADRVGKQRATVANALRLLNLPFEVQSRIQTGEVSMGHAKALASLANTATQIEVADRVARDQLSVRQVEAIVAQALKGRTARASSEPAAADPNRDAAEQTLQSTLGTMVKIIQNKKGKGRLEIHFHDDQELQRLYERLV
jgi:ParB family chromosome partitioning protein